jgi:hypothetical protein
MATHLSVPKVSITSTDSGYDSKKQSKSNILHENDDLAAQDTTVHQQNRSKELPPQSLTLDLLSPSDINEHERHRAGSTGSNVSSYSSNASTPGSTGSTRPLLSDKSTTKSKQGKDHHQLSPHDYVQEPHCVRKISTGSNASSCCSSDTSTPGGTQPLLSGQSTSKPKGQNLLSPNDYVQQSHRSRKASTSSTYSSDVSTPASTRSLSPDQSTTDSKEQKIPPKIDEKRQDAEQQKSSSLEMTSADERILRDTIRREMPKFVNNTDCKTLGSHMHSRSLLHPSNYETLKSIPSNIQRGNHLYMQILPHKGEHTYRLLYKCLENETEHTGHEDLVNILDKALKDGHPPQNSSTSTDTSSAKLNYTDEIILRESVRCEMPKFIDNSDFNTLFSHLYSRKLVHSNDYETLTSMPSDKDRGNHLYMQILPRKGRHAYRRLYKCLRNESEHIGHRDLVKLLDKALKDRNLFHSCTPTEDDEGPEELSTHSQAKLRIRCCVQ